MKIKSLLYSNMQFIVETTPDDSFAGEKVCVLKMYVHDMVCSTETCSLWERRNLMGKEVLGLKMYAEDMDCWSETWSV